MHVKSVLANWATPLYHGFWFPVSLCIHGANIVSVTKRRVGRWYLLTDYLLYIAYSVLFLLNLAITAVLSALCRRCGPSIFVLTLLASLCLFFLHCILISVCSVLVQYEQRYLYIYISYYNIIYIYIYVGIHIFTLSLSLYIYTRMFLLLYVFLAYFVPYYWHGICNKNPLGLEPQGRIRWPAYHHWW